MVKNNSTVTYVLFNRIITRIMKENIKRKNPGYSCNHSGNVKIRITQD